MNKITAAITGLHGWVPDYVLTNKELEQLVDTNDEWITTRTGIKERRILKGEDVGTSYIASKVIKGIIKKTGVDPAEIDLVICCTTTPDMVFPATANIICAENGLVNAWGYDLQAACSGFLFGLTTGAGFIESGRYKKVIVVGADKMSSITNYKDRATCIIFGDGGGGVLLEPSEDGTGIQDFIMHSDGIGHPYLHMKAGGSKRPASVETVTNDEHFVYQEGKTVFKFAVTNMAEVAANLMARNNLVSDEIAWLVPHQANLRIIDATAERCGIPHDKVMINIHKYGNTTNGTIPLCLWEYEDQLKHGDKLILAAFGGGFTWGSLYLTWSIRKK